MEYRYFLDSRVALSLDTNCAVLGVDVGMVAVKISRALELNAEMAETRAWATTQLSDEALDFLFAFLGAKGAKHAQKTVWPELTGRSMIAAIVWLQSAAEYAKVLGK